VIIHVEFNSQSFVEMHVDNGASTQIFLTQCASGFRNAARKEGDLKMKKYRTILIAKVTLYIVVMGFGMKPVITPTNM
jgi:hypothetical protein